MGEATFKINEIVAHVLEGSVMTLQARDTIEMGIPGVGALGLLNSNHQEPVFPPVTLVQPDINTLFYALHVPENTPIEIIMAIRLAYKRSSSRVQA